MKILANIYRLTFLLLILVSVSFAVTAQEKVGNETLAKEYFELGNYEKALPLFAQLIRTNPDNAMYNYYYGVSLVKNNLFETAAKEALLNAIVDKTPSNSNFYMANYFHALENWQEAMDFYDRFSGLAGKQERKNLNLDYYIDLCRKKINPFQVKNGNNQNEVFGDSAKKSTSQPDLKNYPIPDELKNAWLNFQVNEEFVYHSIDDFRSEAGKVLFTKAWVVTGQNDSIITVLDSLRKAHEKTAMVSTRLDLVQQIIGGEQKSYQLLRDREKLFEQARVKESAWWDKAEDQIKIDFKNMLAKRDEERVVALQLAAEKAAAEAARPVPEPVVLPSEPEIEQAEEGKAVENAKEMVEYKVQIGSFRNGVLTPTFKTLLSKLSKLRKIDHYTDVKKYEVYTVGNFQNYDDARKLKDQLVLEGAKGAFLVAYKNGIKVPVAETLKKDSNK